MQLSRAVVPICRQSAGTSTTTGRQSAGTSTSDSNSSVTPEVSRTLAISINDGDGDFSAPVELVVQIDP